MLLFNIDIRLGLLTNHAVRPPGERQPPSFAVLRLGNLRSWFTAIVDNIAYLLDTADRDKLEALIKQEDDVIIRNRLSRSLSIIDLDYREDEHKDIEYDLDEDDEAKSSRYERYLEIIREKEKEKEAK